MALTGVSGALDAPPAHFTTTEASIDSAWPPERYRNDVEAAPTFYVAQDRLERLCGWTPPRPGVVLLGCERGGMIFLPNPCWDVRYSREKFAELVCHEMGHANGWSGKHPRP